MKFSEEKLKKVQEIIERYPEGKQKSALIPLLHLAQEENGGWLSVEAMDHVAELLQLKPIEVYEVATFYSMFPNDFPDVVEKRVAGRIELAPIVV